MFRRLSAQPPPGWAADCHHRAPVRQRHHRPDPLLRFHRHARGSLTDRPDSPVARCAQTTLLCHVELMGMTNSFTSMVGLVDTLAMLYTFTSGAPTQEEKTCRDTLHRKFDSCFSDPNTSI